MYIFYSEGDALGIKSREAFKRNMAGVHFALITQHEWKKNLYNFI